jgi:hypothetical protein
MPPEQSPLEWVTATLPKAGLRPEENEDAVAADAAKMRFAVADGASEGWQSRAWASRLAGGFLHHPPTPADFARWLAAARKWSPPAAAGTWYAEAKSEQGSFATLLGLELRRPADGAGLAWRAIAVGDSCLLVVRDGRVETAFPVSSADGFGNRTPLIPSSSAAACPWPQWMAGRAAPGDLMLLATDAVARHLLGLGDARAWEPVLAAVTQSLASASSDLVLQLLLGLQPTLNDDASVVAIRIPTASEPPA